MSFISAKQLTQHKKASKDTTTAQTYTYPRDSLSCTTNAALTANSSIAAKPTNLSPNKDFRISFESGLHKESNLVFKLRIINKIFIP